MFFLLFSDVEQEKLIKLLSNLKEESVLNGTSVQESFKSLCHVLDEKQNDSEKLTQSACVLFATAITEHLITLSDVASLTDNGGHYPLFLLILQYLHKKCGRSELSTMFNKSKVIATRNFLNYRKKGCNLFFFSLFVS